jgi:hypothetical protein
VGDDLCERERGGFDVHPAFDHLQVGGDAAQVVVCCAVGEVAEAEGLGDFAGGEEFFELDGEEKWLVSVDTAGTGGGGRGGRGAGMGGAYVCTLGGMSRARSGMCKSPITRIRNAIVSCGGSTAPRGATRGWFEEGAGLEERWLLQDKP